MSWKKSASNGSKAKVIFIIVLATRGDLGSVVVLACNSLLESFLPIDGIGSFSFGLGSLLCFLLFCFLLHLLLLGEFFSNSLSLTFGETHELRVVGVGKDDGGVVIIVFDGVGCCWQVEASFRSPFSKGFLEHFLPDHVIFGKIVGVSIALNKEKGGVSERLLIGMYIPMKRLPIGRDRGIQKCISEVQDPIP